jgi:hypothetical protein
MERPEMDRRTILEKEWKDWRLDRRAIQEENWRYMVGYIDVLQTSCRVYDCQSVNFVEQVD